MVGLGHLGSESALARVSLVNYHGHVIYDTFVQPRERVTDWRTWVSGVRESDIANAPAFDEVQKKVADLVDGRVLIGHAIENDTKVSLQRSDTDSTGTAAQPSQPPSEGYPEMQAVAGKSQDEATRSEEACRARVGNQDPGRLA